MEVLEYLKNVNRQLKEGASDDAREMGLEYAGYGKWRDPKTGTVTHKSLKSGGQTTLQKLDPKDQPQQKSAAPAGDQKTLRDVRKDQQPRVRKDLARTAKDKEEEALFAAQTASQGMWPHYSPERKQFHIDQQKQIAADQEEAERLEREEQEAKIAKDNEKASLDAAKAAELESEPSKDREEFRTVDEVIEEQGDDEIDDDAIDQEMEDIESDYRAAIEAATERQRKALDKRYGAFREAMSNIPAGTERSSFLQAMAHAKTFEGRVNAGAGKNNLGYGDIQNLMANRDRLLEGYGDGSPEQIKEFVESVRSNKVDDEFVDASFEILPDAFKKSLSGKGQVTNDKYVSDDKAHKDMHYLGKDEDGNARRGAANNKDRAKLMWRIYLEQGGRDAYTGLPLDIQAMDLEHVRGFNNKDGGKPSKEQWEQRENDDNFTLINSNINQKKVDMSMKDFFEREVDPLKDKGEDEFGGIEKLFEKQNQIGTVGDQLAKTLLGEGGKGMGDTVTREILSEHFGNDDRSFTELRDEFRKFATDDKTKKKAAGMKSKLGKTVLKSMGLSRGITDPSGRRTVALQENVYRGFLNSMANAKPADRQKYMDGWAEAIKAGNEERSPKAVNKKLVELGLIDDDILNDKKAGKVFKEEYGWDDGPLLFHYKFRKG